MKTGRITASAVDTPPMVPAVARTAPVRTEKPAGSEASSLPSGRPQRISCSFTWRKSISRKPPAVRANTHQDTPPASMLTGTL